MILIYTEETTPRITYITHLIFTQILNIEVILTTNSQEFKHSKLPKFNYSFEKFGDELYLKPHRLMHMNAIIAPSINSVWYEGEKYFFESSKDSVFPFDLFAASFYLVSRYEEYLDGHRDHLGRFPPERSILSKYGLLRKPVVNIWAQMLADKLLEEYPELHIPERKFKFFSTIDIDNAWAYKNKGIFRNTGAMARCLLQCRFTEFRSRFNTLIGSEKDPYETYDYLDEQFKGNEEKVKFFFLMGDYGRYDKNISYKNRRYQKLIRRIAGKYETGIHPSFNSSKKKGKIRVAIERKRLEDITGKDCNSSRQHFLRLRFPKTYRRLLKNGIAEDYTMGYSAQPGFRAGICTPYLFYDLKKEKVSNLLINPFTMMDGTFRYYLRATPEEAWQQIQALMEEVNKVKGTFVAIWHNETITNTGLWKGYRRVFEQMNRLGFEWADAK